VPSPRRFAPPLSRGNRINYSVSLYSGEGNWLWIILSINPQYIPPLPNISLLKDMIASPRERGLGGEGIGFLNRRRVRPKEIFYLVGFILSKPVNLCSTLGMRTDPSGCWNCSTIAGSRRLVAKPEPFKLWINSFLPVV